MCRATCYTFTQTCVEGARIDCCLVVVVEYQCPSDSDRCLARPYFEVLILFLFILCSLRLSGNVFLKSSVLVLNAFIETFRRKDGLGSDLRQFPNISRRMYRILIFKSFFIAVKRMRNPFVKYSTCKARP